MVGPLIPFGVILGKADTAFKFVGGSSIIFNALRSRIFGKILRVVEYPDGELKTVKIYRMTIYRLKLQIANTQRTNLVAKTYLEPEDVKQISLFTSPHFTEEIEDDSSVSGLPDNAWLFWSKDGEVIPKRGVKLDGSHINTTPKLRQNDEVTQNIALNLAKSIRSNNLFNRVQFDRIVDLAIDRDVGLLAIARNFNDEKQFRHHSLRLLSRRDPKNILLGANVDNAASDVSDSDDDLDKRNIEPQVELASRE